MSKQRESILVADPFTIFLRGLGWTVDNVHGNQYQKGFPDKYIHSQIYHPRWIEFKVFDKYDHVKYTDAQKKVFPIWNAHNIPIFVIAAYDLRGERNYLRRQHLYKKLFEEPNVMYLFSKMSHCLLK